MRDDDKTDLPGWLGLKRTPDFDKARWLGSALSVVVIVLFGMAVLVVFAVLGHALFGLGMDDVPRIGFGTGAVAVALIGAPFVIWRSMVAQKTVTLQEQGHITDRINTAVQGLGAEKTLKVREFVPKYKTKEGRRERDEEGNPVPLRRGDGSQQGRWDVSEETQPNLEVRIGAIYALERIAQDSDRDHVQIMEILCTYIRQNAPAPAEDDWPELKMYDSEDDGPLEADWDDRRITFLKKHNKRIQTLKKPREDIQTALTVIGRRSARQRRLEAGRGVAAEFPFDNPCPVYHGPDEEYDQAAIDAYREELKIWKGTLTSYSGYRLDLRHADLRGTDLEGAALNGARLNGSCLQGANLRQALLQGGSLRKAKLQGANLRAAQLQGAGLGFAQLQAADLRNASCQGARLESARLQGSRVAFARLNGTILQKARLQGARFGAARLQGAVVREARFQGAYLGEVRLQGASLREVRLQGANLGEGRLQGAYLVRTWLDKDTDLTAATLLGAAMRSVDCTGVPQIEAHLGDMFGDASVTLSEGHGPGDRNWPNHWPWFELRSDFFNEWHAWQTILVGSHPPSDPPEPEDTA